jgi:type II secretory pathway pseudopilin PulG
MRAPKGHSLIELFIIVAIILFIAAIAIPNLLKARILASEYSAVGSMRTLTTANIQYQCPANGFPAAQANLAPGVGTCAAATYTQISIVIRERNCEQNATMWSQGTGEQPPGVPPRESHRTVGEHRNPYASHRGAMPHIHA